MSVHDHWPAQSTGPVLAVRGLAKSFGGSKPRTLFADLDLNLERGEFIAVMGESGSGKSTLLNLIAGLDHADAGSVAVNGIDVTGLTEDQRARLRRTHLGFVFQAFHLLPYASVEDNVALPLLLIGCPKSERGQRVARILREVGLEDRRASMPRELSGGEMQRVALARALVHSPQLVLADEPTGNLDVEHATQVLALLRQSVDRSGAACILVTHSLVAARLADRIYTLDATGLRIRPPP